MKRATVVIGANYGDEGKGRVVDYLASQLPGEKVVVRFNGGAQAGHTVVTPDGKRHVFSHFAAGTLAGAHTYLARHFVCNPLAFWKESHDLKDLNVRPVISADPRCFVTTPYDMLINQLVEDARGDKRHGSVGVGFGETIERNIYPSFQLWKSDLTDRDVIERKLRLVRDHWMPTRCRQLKIKNLPKDDHRMSDEILDKTVTAFTAFETSVGTAGAEFIERKSIIFEGAQGLCLDMDSHNFPHVTRSKTGLANIVPIARGLGLGLDVVYVTRPYLTKHGAGPLATQYEPNPPIFDETNTPHPYQGTLRFGHLDVGEMRDRIAKDLEVYPGAKETVALTCVDHVTKDRFAELSRQIGNVRLFSDGPRRDQMHLM